MKQQFLVNTADTFRTYVFENNRRIVPSSARITVYRPGGDVLLVDDAPMTVTTDGLISYALSPSDNSAPEVNYRAAISYVYDSIVHSITLFYDVVRSKLVKVITDDDIVAELPQIKDNGWRVRGVAGGGSLTTIADPELKRYEDGYFTGGVAYSADKDETREVIGFASSTGTVTVSAFSSAVTAGEKYVLTRSYSKEIQRAFEKIEERIMRLGKRPELILDPYDLREVHICYSVSEVCKGFVTGEENFWWRMWKEYEKRAEEAFAGINLKYDASMDGYIAGSEESARVNVLKAFRE